MSSAFSGLHILRLNLGCLAETQGRTDRYIGSWLKTRRRDDIIVATKVLQGVLLNLNLNLYLNPQAVAVAHSKPCSASASTLPGPSYQCAVGRWRGTGIST